MRKVLGKINPGWACFLEQFIIALLVHHPEYKPAQDFSLIYLSSQKKMLPNGFGWFK
jgi:hypothetical protein